MFVNPDPFISQTLQFAQEWNITGYNCECCAKHSASGHGESLELHFVSWLVFCTLWSMMPGGSHFLCMTCCDYGHCWSLLWR